MHNRLCPLFVSFYAVVYICITSESVIQTCLGFVDSIVPLSVLTDILGCYVFPYKICRAKYVGVI